MIVGVGVGVGVTRSQGILAFTLIVTDPPEATVSFGCPEISMQEEDTTFSVAIELTIDVAPIALNITLYLLLLSDDIIFDTGRIEVVSPGMLVKETPLSIDFCH